MEIKNIQLIENIHNVCLAEIQMLLTTGQADPNAKDTDGTPAIVVAMNKLYEKPELQSDIELVIKILIDNGARLFI